MSDSYSDIAGLITEAGQIVLAYRVAISGTEIWKSKFRGAQSLFFLTRYSYMVLMVLYCAENLIRNPSQTMSRSCLRCDGSMTQIGVYGVANVAVGVYIGVLEKPQVGDVQLASTSIALTLDILVFGFTFSQTLHHAREMRKFGLRNGLGYFMLRDVVGFRARLLIGVVSTTIFFRIIRGIGNIRLTVILINRLVLNLRQVSHLQEGHALTLDATGTIREPVFATNSILGNIGAPLRVGSEDDGEVEEIGVDAEAEVVEDCRMVDRSGITETCDPSDS
ncbi:hypothetical protein BD410DRAFT_866715 [Rickenella mellea]|uniref:Uncharacterized protein n=1 Tax=Rickenella mellea TaxID=50990 RepID=A0A4Y7Q208_9AGAM|nr:hypothetical protein BD410DRAFT_866715 [Rickenella mellea]